jgi:spermidine synthase
LLLGGGVAGTAAELLKYPLARLDYVELDPLLLEAVRATRSDPQDETPDALADPRLRTHLTDARHFVRRTEKPYDVIIVDLPDPSTAQLNRFHTREFFSQARKALAKHGVLSVGLSHYENRMTPELESLVAIPARTLHESFANILILPGGHRIHFLASDGPLTSSLEARAEERPALEFYPEVPRLLLTPERLEDLKLAAEMPARANSDLNPHLYLHHLTRTLSQYRTRYGIFVTVLAVVLVVFLARARAAQVGLLAAGFSASALNVVVLLAFQTVHGALYRDLGWLTAAFMSGLALGAAWAGRKVLRPAAQASSLPPEVDHAPDMPPTSPKAAPHGAYLRIILGLTALAALMPAILWLLEKMEFPFSRPLSVYVLFPLVLVLVAGLVGAAFPLAAQVDFEDSAKTTSRTFLADYVGSFFGALLVSTLLIPLLGVVATCLISAGLNLLAAGVVWSRRGQYGVQSRA